MTEKLNAINQTVSTAASRAQSLIAQFESLRNTDSIPVHIKLRALDQIIELSDALHDANDSADHIKQLAVDFKAALNQALDQALDRVNHINSICDKLEHFCHA